MFVLNTVRVIKEIFVPENVLNFLCSTFLSFLEIKREQFNIKYYTFLEKNINEFLCTSEFKYS